MSTVLDNNTLTLFNAIAAAAELPEEEVYSPRDNVASAEHTLHQERAFFSAIEASINDKIVNKIDVDPEEYRILRVYAEKLRKSENDVISAKKRAAETAVIISSKFDAAQVLSLVKQIPSGLLKDLDIIITDLLQVIIDHIELVFDKELNDGGLARLVSSNSGDNNNTNGVVSFNKRISLLLESVLSHEYLNKMRRMKVAQLNNTVVDRLKQTINQMTVPTRNNVTGLLELDDKDTRSTVDEIQEMLDDLIVSDA